MRRALRGRGVGVFFVLVAIGMGIWFGRDLAYALDGGGSPGVLNVQRCERHVERVNHRMHSEKRRVYRCTGTFVPRDGGTVSQEAQAEMPLEAQRGARVQVVQVRGDHYTLPGQDSEADAVVGLGAAAAVLAVGIFGLLTGYALRPEDDLRTAARSLPAARMLGPLLALVAGGGVLTAAVAGFLR